MRKFSAAISLQEASSIGDVSLFHPLRQQRKKTSHLKPLRGTTTTPPLTARITPSAGPESGPDRAANRVRIRARIGGPERPESGTSPGQNSKGATQIGSLQPLGSPVKERIARHARTTGNERRHRSRSPLPLRFELTHGSLYVLGRGMRRAGRLQRGLSAGQV